MFSFRWTIILNIQCSELLFETDIIIAMYSYTRGRVNQKFPSLTEFFLAVTEKFEGRPSFWQIALKVIYCNLHL